MDDMTTQSQTQLQVPETPAARVPTLDDEYIRYKMGGMKGDKEARAKLFQRMIDTGQAWVMGDERLAREVEEAIEKGEVRLAT